MFKVLLVLGLIGCFTAATAQVAHLPSGGIVTEADLDAYAETRLPDAGMRRGMLARASNVEKMVQEVAVRKELASRAKSIDLQTSPAVKALIQAATDKILADAWSDEFEKLNQPSAKALEDNARVVYTTEAKRFEVPAQTRARHILIRGDVTVAKTKIADLKAKLSSDPLLFEAIAKEHSEDPSNAQKGGDLGYFSMDTMVAPFQAALEALQKPGDVSEAVETQFGIHLIQLVDRRPAGVKPFDEVREGLIAEARKKLVREMFQANSAQILAKTKINGAEVEQYARKKLDKP